MDQCWHLNNSISGTQVFDFGFVTEPIAGRFRENGPQLLCRVSLTACNLTPPYVQCMSPSHDTSSVSGPNSHLVKDKSGTPPTNVTQPDTSLCGPVLLCRVKQMPLSVLPDYLSCHKLLSLLLLLVCFPENTLHSRCLLMQKVLEK